MKKFITLVTALFCISTMAVAGETTFVFNTEEAITAFGIAIPELNNATSVEGMTFTSDGVVMSDITSGSTATRIWRSSNNVYDFRIYKNGTFKITAPAGQALTTIKLVGNAVNVFTVSTGNISSGVWSGESESVTFTATGTGKFNTVTVTFAEATGVTAPTFSVSEGNYYEPQTVAITAPAGNIFYSTDGTNFSAYTAPITIAETTTLYAYCEVDGKKSATQKVTYKIAKEYASLNELIQETPTTEGWPVIVPVVEEEIASFYISTSGTTQYRNGVYLVRQANGKNFELYKSNVPAKWQVGDKISGTAKGIYQNYNGQWEISLTSWDGFSNGVEDVKAPVITFDQSTKTVSIADPSGNNYTIYYTTDGTDPEVAETQSVKVYEAPFTIEKTTTVKAICANDEDVASNITTKTCAIASGAAGTEADPYMIDDVKAIFADGDTISDKWVKGYIVGYANTSLSNSTFSADGAIQSNILIADEANCTDVDRCLPIALENSPETAKAIRLALNLMDNPGNLGKQVMLNGSVIKYFGVAGMKQLVAYKLEGQGLKGDANGDSVVDVADITAIASYILGTTPEGFNADNADANSDTVIDVADITATASIILGN